MTWQIPEDLALYNWSLDWRVPVCSSLLYAVVVTYFSRRNVRLAKAAGAAPAGSAARADPWTLFRVLVLAHNILLTVFSAFVFFSVFPLLLASLRFRSFYDSFCDVGGWAYRHGLGFWTWVFYMSKYYELLDTAILLAKGRPSSFLQTFHHAGSIISMWSLASTRAFGAWVFVGFNSFIHTLMYFYYTLTCFGFHPSWKPLMTFLQIAQFVIGLPIAIVYVLVPGCMSSVVHPKNTLAHLLGTDGYWSNVIALAFTAVYVLYLIVLFVNFARRTYFGGSKAGRARDAAGPSQPKRSNKKLN